jgi:hypothetical protein
MLLIGLIVLGAFAVELARMWWEQTAWRRELQRRRREEHLQGRQKTLRDDAQRALQEDAQWLAKVVIEEGVAERMLRIELAERFAPKQLGLG